MVREPVVAGMFYEGGKEGLKDQIKESFLSKLGPGSLPKKSSKKRILGLVSPHAGFAYSGPAAAYGFKELKESEKPDTFVILSPNHTGFGRTSVLLDDYKTPLGIVKTNKELGKKILDNCPKIANDVVAHMNEHSLEVQLPFLQYIYKDFKIVPIVISSPINCLELAISLGKAIKDSNEKICIIASSDFTHYGPGYEYNIFANNIKKQVRELDMGAIELIKELNVNKFLEYIGEHNATICGHLPIAVLLKALEGEIKDVDVLTYYRSDEIVDDENTVGYASIVFR